MTLQTEDLLACTAARTPDADAIVLRHRCVSFEELLQRTNAVGLSILERVGLQGTVVGVLLSDRAETASVTLGIERAGLITISFEPKDPIVHLRAIVTLTGVELLVADRSTIEVAELVGEGLCKVWLLDQSMYDERVATDGTLPSFDPTSPAMLVSSSGTSGRPKAIAHSHESLQQVAAHLASSLQITSDEHVGALDSFAYAGVNGTFRAALYAGAPIAFYNLKESGLAGYPQWLRDNEITFMRMQTAVLRSINESGGHVRDTPLRTVSAAGESIFGQDVRNFRSAFPSAARVECRYSASEVYDIARQMFPAGEQIGDGPIRYTDVGQGISIVGPDGNPVSPGDTGEIVATNPTVGIGYWNERTLTAERFDLGPGQLRTFRTGDLGRFAEDGALELAGRSDTRVKVRGVNVELVNVEDALISHPDITDVAVSVIDRAGGGNTLVAYYVPRPGSFPGAGSLRRHVAARLPSANVPTQFNIVNELPRTGSGKVDRTQLQRSSAELLDFVGRRQDQSTKPPTSKIEHQLHDRIRKLLELDRLGVTDDFFDVGGDSLSAIELVAWISDEFGVDLGVAAVIEAPTIEALAARISTPERSRLGNVSVLVDCENPRAVVTLIAGAGDSAISQLALARSLGDGLLVLGAQGRGIDDTKPAERSIARYASRIVKDLGTLAPAAPHIISGYSFGGVVAVEVAHRLERLGTPASGVIILDTPAPEERSRRIRDFVLNRSGASGRAKRFTPLGGLRLLYRTTRAGLNDRLSTRQARDDQRVHSQLRKSHVYNVNLSAITFWPDREIAAPTLLVRAQSGHTANQPLEEGWRERTRNVMTTAHVKGTHASMMYVPFVFTVGDTIRTWIEELPL
jgi:acyl-coenzyme A synthetase/AMP-(fatty) acid ligase/thioesterase domain-containing protein/acyl carrier protein